MLRRSLRWTPPVEEHVIDAGEDVRLLVRASWQPGRREDHPLLVIVHGLGGSDGSTYVLSTGLAAYARGFHVLRGNMRGAGDGETLCPRLYNAGLDTDLMAVLRFAAEQGTRVVVAGFSLGGNLALLAAGRRRGEVPTAVERFAAVGTPLDLAACATALERRANGLYQRYFMKALATAYQRRQALLPALYEAGRDRGLLTVRQFDAAITAPYGGYGSVEEYYERSSSGPWLQAIERPTLVVNAADDPMVPIESTLGFPLPTSGIVRREVFPTGGHVGFVGRSRAPGYFWAADRVLDFFS